MGSMRLTLTVSLNWMNLDAYTRALIKIKERIVNIWNVLKDDFVCSSSLNMFKMVFINYRRNTVCR